MKAFTQWMINEGNPTADCTNICERGTSVDLERKLHTRDTEGQSGWKNGYIHISKY